MRVNGLEFFMYIITNIPTIATIADFYRVNPSVAFYSGVVPPPTPVVPASAPKPVD